MTAPMTPERLRDLRFAIERAKSDADREDLHPDDDINHVVGLELLDEIDRLRTHAAEEERRKLALGVEMSRAWADAYTAIRNEVERLRALPVLRTCGECPAHAEVGDEGPNGADGIGYVCGHHEDLRATAPGDTPPSWCPLRGGER